MFSGPRAGLFSVKIREKKSSHSIGQRLTYCARNYPYQWFVHQQLNVTFIECQTNVSMLFSSMCGMCIVPNLNDIIFIRTCMYFVHEYWYSTHSLNPPMVWPFKICLLAKWLSKCMNLLKHSIIFCYCTTTPFNTLWKDLKGRKIGLWYVCSESCFTFQNLS